MAQITGYLRGITARIYSYSYGRKFSVSLYFIYALDFYESNECCQTSCCCPFCKLIECRFARALPNRQQQQWQHVVQLGTKLPPCWFLCVYSFFWRSYSSAACCHIFCCCCIFISLSPSQFTSQLASQQSQFNAHAAINADCEWEWDCYGINWLSWARVGYGEGERASGGWEQQDAVIWWAQSRGFGEIFGLWPEESETEIKAGKAARESEWGGGGRRLESAVGYVDCKCKSGEVEGVWLRIGACVVGDGGCKSS